MSQCPGFNDPFYQDNHLYMTDSLLSYETFRVLFLYEHEYKWRY